MTILWYYDLRMNRVDIRELECFVAVADQLNFSKAARLLHLSQPPLTRHVQALEEKLGTKIFTRNTHAVSLTEAGVSFLEDARSILRHLDRATEAVRAFRPGETGRLRLAFIAALLDDKFIRLIQRFRNDHPGYRVEVSDLVAAPQMAALQSGDLDGGFIGIKPLKPVKGLSFTDWKQEPLLLVLPEKDPLNRVEKLRWQHLRGLLWVMLGRQEAAAFRQEISKIFDSYGLTAQIVQESNRAQAVLTMVAAGIGVSIFPQSVKYLIPSGVVFRPLPHPQPILQSVFAYRSGETSPALEKFLSLLKISAQNAA